MSPRLNVGGGDRWTRCDIVGTVVDFDESALLGVEVSSASCLAGVADSDTLVVLRLDIASAIFAIVVFELCRLLERGAERMVRSRGRILRPCDEFDEPARSEGLVGTGRLIGKPF